MLSSVTGINVNNNYQTAFRAKKPNRKELHEFIDESIRQIRLEELRERSPEEYKLALEKDSTAKFTLSVKVNMAKEFIKKIFTK